MEFDDLKEYTYGDDVHDIDWKSSSRMDSILVRRYMTDRRHNVMFILDRGEKLLGDTDKGESKKELMLMTFGTLAYIVGRNGAEFALAYPGEKNAKVSYFKSGTDHLERLLYDYEEHSVTDSHQSLTDTIKEILNTVKKRMIIFLLTDPEGLTQLSEGLIKSITTGHDLLVINIEDAYLTSDVVFDNTLSRYEKFFLAHNSELHKEEVWQRQEIVSAASGIFKRNRACMASLSREEDIIDSAIALLERYRNGYYG